MNATDPPATREVVLDLMSPLVVLGESTQTAHYPLSGILSLT